ncbi:MAG: MoaD family protein [Cellvibrionaceae bacterium]
MTIQIDIPAVMRSLTENNKKINSNGNTLEQLINNMNESYPGLKDRLISNGELNRYINIFVNEDDVRFSGDLQAQVKSGDVVTILPAVAGG